MDVPKKIPDTHFTNRVPRTESGKQWANGSQTGKIYRSGDEYTVVKDRYEYKQVTWTEFLDNKYTGYKTVRSSFIPYVKVNGENYWLLGSFWDYPNDILSDFGGSCILYDPPKKYAKGIPQQENIQHQFGCAVLELNEETKGLLVQQVLKSVGTTKPTVYMGINERKREKVWFVIVFLNYDEVKNIPEEFETTKRVNKGEKLGPLGFYKESDILGLPSKYRLSRNLADFINYIRIISK